jgi:alkylmercury lyase
VRTSQDRLESLATAVSKAAPDFDDEEQWVALEVYRRLAEGLPVAPATVAAGSDVSAERIEALLASWPGVYLDEGKVVGFWGLTIRRLTPTHRLEIDGRELFAWCAWDTLFLPGILGATVHVQSWCPITGERISLEVSPNRVERSSHTDVAVSFLLPDRTFDADVIQSFCHYVHFFASRDAGASWTSTHPGTFLLSLEDAFELGRLVDAKNFPSRFGARR